MDELKLNTNDFLPLRDVVFHTLREAILKGKLKPGERLMEISLAGKLGVSRTPVREAIRMLELEGLVVMVPRKGASVAGITVKSLMDVLEVRKALEELSVTLACQRMAKEDWKRLREAARGFERAVAEKQDVTGLAQADEAFHDVIYYASGNDKLIHLLNQMREQMYRYRVEHVKGKERHKMIMDEHRELTDCIERRDEAAAKACIDRHIDNQILSIMEGLEK